MKIQLEVTVEERNIILAALRLWNDVVNDDAGYITPELLDIATDGENHALLDDNQIDTLCERINGQMSKKRIVKKAELLTYLNTPAGRAAFESGFGAPGRTPENYLEEYSDRPGIVHGLALDTGFYKNRDGKEFWEDAD